MRPAFLVLIRSFRLRVALLSVLVSGVALVIFVALTLGAMYRLGLQRMDEDIREFAHRHLLESRGPGYWERVNDSIRFFLGDNDGNAFVLLVKDRDGMVKYTSPNWPSEMPADVFPATSAWGHYSAVSPFSPPRARLKDAPSDDLARRPGPDETASQPREQLPLKLPEFSTRKAGGTTWRIGMMGTRDITIVLGLNMIRLTREMAQVRHALAVVLPITLLFVGLGAWWMSQRALKPITAVTETIKRVKARGLDQRISGQDEEHEFEELIAVFNDMMDWLEKSFHQAIRFSADASHELKTPLTVLQAQLEQAVREAAPGSDEQRRYVAFGKELQRLKSITQKLLLLSRIDAGELTLSLRPMNLSQLAEGTVEDTETLAPQLRVESDLEPELWVMADADLMKQVIQNLASNAIKYNADNGFVRLALCADDANVRLTIANSGRGIPLEDRDKVFTRFYRGDKARDRRVGGAGLGLSLAREIVRAHHGDLVLEQASDEITSFVLTLPRATP